MEIISNNENKSICSLCNGQCCRQSACILHPNQVDLTLTGIKERIQNGYCFDWWEGDIDPHNKQFDRIYLMRPQHTNAKGKQFDPSWGGTCIFLADNGCSLTWEDRPFQGKALIPRMKNDYQTDCYWNIGGTKRELVNEWRKVQHLIIPIINEL